MSSNQKPNVAIFTSAARGLAHYVAHLYPELSKHAKLYYVTYAGQPVDDLVTEEVGRVYQLIQNQSASSVLETLRFLQSKKIDLINIHVSDTVRRMHIQYFGMIAYAKYLGIPVCLTLHDVLTLESLSIDPSAIELLYSLGDSFIVGNTTEQDKLELYFNKQEADISVVHHGPYTLFDHHKISVEHAKQELGLTGKKVILFFGQIRPNKGLKYLIKALPHILKEQPDAFVYISTDLHMSTPELNEFLARIEKSGVRDRVQLVRDYVPSSEIEKIFKAADIVALPYTRVSQSGILNLAFAFKKPVVVSDIFSEAADINGKFGFTFKSEDHKALAASINQILSMPDLGRSMGEAGYNFAQSSRSWEQAAHDTLKAYDIALSKRDDKKVVGA